MTVFNVATPAGTDPINEGDDRIRELKLAIQEALQAEGSFPGAAPLTAPKYIPTVRSGNTATRDALAPATGQIYINTETLQFELYNGATWDAIVAVPDDSITAAKIAVAVAGDGLSGGGGSALAVNAGTGLEINSDAIRIAAAAAGDGLSGGAGTALSVNVDDSTVELNSDALRVKDAGVTEAKLATAVVNKLGQNIGLVSLVDISGEGTPVNYSGQGRLLGIACSFTSTNISVTVDGVEIFDAGVLSNEGLIWGQAGIVADASGTLNSLDIHFRTSLVIVVTGAGSVGKIAYERQA